VTRPSTSERLQRLLVLVPWVMSHPDSSVAEVCERFRITREELLADLDLLFVCGLPPFGPGDLMVAYVDGDRVVIEDAEPLARPLRLTRWEALRLLVAGRALAALGGLAEADSLHRALAKLEAALTPEEAAAARELAARVAVDLDGTGAEPLLGPLRDAIAERRRLRITYYSFGRDEITEREVDPLLVFAARGNWYLFALDRASGEGRVFRVDRIREWAPTGETFSPPEGVDLDAVARRPLFAPSPRDIEVTIELAPRAAWVREVTPHERAEALDEGWTRLVLRTPHLEWAARLVLRLGDDARVVGPPELARRVRELARRALARYEDPVPR
jgi:proteasome accessory factor C